MSKPLRQGRVPVGGFVSARWLTTIRNESVEVPDPARLVHLQFRRFAGCPVCHLHLRSVLRRREEIEAAGVREVVIFHSSAEDLRVHAGDLPLAVVADPQKRLYREFGVESSPRALLDPRVWLPILRAVLLALWAIVAGGRAVPPLRPDGGSLGLPADFLIASDGTVVAAYYGKHADDQWSVEELLRLADRRLAESTQATTADVAPTIGNTQRPRTVHG